MSESEFPEFKNFQNENQTMNNFDSDKVQTMISKLRKSTISSAS
jgi:hypothetical protein